jgi:hypothetical protein
MDAHITQLFHSTWGKVAIAPQREQIHCIGAQFAATGNLESRAAGETMRPYAMIVNPILKVFSPGEVLIDKPESQCRGGPVRSGLPLHNLSTMRVDREGDM